ncbi:hypothetical protein EG867_16830, partial [Enterococcus faecalis]
QVFVQGRRITGIDDHLRQVDGGDLVDGVEGHGGPAVGFQRGDHPFTVVTGGGIEQIVLGVLQQSRTAGEHAGGEGLFAVDRVAGEVQTGKGQRRGGEDQKSGHDLFPAKQQVKQHHEGENPDTVGTERLSDQILEADQYRLHPEPGQQDRANKLRQPPHLSPG